MAGRDGFCHAWSGSRHGSKTGRNNTRKTRSQLKIDTYAQCRQIASCESHNRDQDGKRYRKCAGRVVERIGTSTRGPACRARCEDRRRLLFNRALSSQTRSSKKHRAFKNEIVVRHTYSLCEWITCNTCRRKGRKRESGFYKSIFVLGCYGAIATNFWSFAESLQEIYEHQLPRQQN